MMVPRAIKGSHGRADGRGGVTRRWMTDDGHIAYDGRQRQQRRYYTTIKLCRRRGAAARRQQRDDGGGTILPRGHGCAMNTGEDTGGEEGEAERLRSKRTARQEKVPRGGEEEGDGHSGDGR